MSYPSQIQTRNMLTGWQKRAGLRDPKHAKITIFFTDSLLQHLSQYVVQLFITRTRKHKGKWSCDKETVSKAQGLFAAR